MSTMQQQPHLTLDEYAQGIAAGETPPAPPETKRRPRWLIGVLGGSEHKGRWRLGSRLRIVAVLGGVTLDLGQAEPDMAESLITAVAVLGGVEIMAPPGVPIELTGVSLLGGKSDERTAGPRLPGCPLVRVRTFCFFGGVKVKERKKTS